MLPFESSGASVIQSTEARLALYWNVWLQFQPAVASTMVSCQVDSAPAVHDAEHCSEAVIASPSLNVRLIGCILPGSSSYHPWNWTLPDCVTELRVPSWISVWSLLTNPPMPTQFAAYWFAPPPPEK